jgi:hypothetical protein
MHMPRPTAAMCTPDLFVLLLPLLLLRMQTQTEGPATWHVCGWTRAAAASGMGRTLTGTGTFLVVERGALESGHGAAAVQHQHQQQQQQQPYGEHHALERAAVVAAPAQSSVCKLVGWWE